MAEAGGRLESLVVVSGERWTDAVVAAPLAGRLGTAVLMSPPAELRADAAEFVGRVGVKRALVIGPSGAGGGAQGDGRGVGGEVVSALRAVGVSVERVVGDSLYGTSVAAARRIGAAGVLGGRGRTVVVASGVVFADALVAGPFAARGGHPVLLTPPDGLNPEVARFLGEGRVDSAVVMGGTSAVSQRVRDEIRALGIESVPVSGASRFDTAVKAAELVMGAYSDPAGRECFSSSTVGLARTRVPFDSFSAAPLLARLCAPLLLTDPGRVPPGTADFIDAARRTHSTVRLRVFGGDAAVSKAALVADLGADDGDESVVGAADTPEPFASDCRPAGGGGHVTTGFPLHDEAAPSTGSVRVAVLFVDFPDAVAEHSTHAEVENLPRVEEYLGDWSGGRLDVEFVVLHEWLRADKGWEHYAGGGHRWLHIEASQISVDLARGKLDFDDIDVVMTVFPSDQFGIATALGTVTAGGREMPSFRMNVSHTSQWTGQRLEIRSNSWAMAHELLHVLGLADLYGTRGETPPRRSGTKLTAFDFGIMGLQSYVYLDNDDPVLQGNVPLDPTVYPFDHWVRFYEMLAWSRRQLGWLASSQHRCITADYVVVSLDPLGSKKGRTLMAAVPVSHDKVIVAEARADDRWSPAFANSGVLVYAVDAAKGELPIEIHEPDGSEVISSLPLLTEGESVTVWGYEFWVTGKTGDAYNLTIAKAE